MGFFSEEAGIVTAVSSAIAVKITFLILPYFLSVIVVLCLLSAKIVIFCGNYLCFLKIFAIFSLTLPTKQSLRVTPFK